MSPASQFGRRQSTTSGLTWGYYGCTQWLNGTPTQTANGTLTLVASRTQQIEAGYVSTTTTAITGISIANPCVITVASHTYDVGDVLWLTGIAGTVQINNSFAKVTAKTATTITLAVSSTGMTAWTSGGTLAKVTTAGTVAFKIGLGHGTAFVAPISLYQVVAGASTVTSYTDYRLPSNPIYSRLSKSVAGSANVTLTLDEQRNNQVEFTGTLTGNINVIVLSVANQWIMTNNTSGAFTLTVITPTGTGTVLAAATSKVMFCDGTNVLAI